MYCCKRDIQSDALDPDQYKRVKEFFTQFDATKGDHPGLYQTFDMSEAFQKLLLKNLQDLLFEYGKQFKGSPIAPEVVQVLTPKSPNNLPRRAAGPQSFRGADIQDLQAAACGDTPGCPLSCE